MGAGAEAVDAIDEAISLLQLHTPNRVRDLVHYKIRLASAYALQDDLDHAASVAREAYHLITEIDSARIRERFLELVAHLTRFYSAVIQEAFESFDLRSF